MISLRAVSSKGVNKTLSSCSCKGKKLIYLSQAEIEKRRKEKADVVLNSVKNMLTNWTILRQLFICAFIQLGKKVMSINFCICASTEVFLFWISVSL